jgi:hypothetical protein
MLWLLDSGGLHASVRFCGDPTGEVSYVAFGVAGGEAVHERGSAAALRPTGLTGPILTRRRTEDPSISFVTAPWCAPAAAAMLVALGQPRAMGGSSYQLVQCLRDGAVRGGQFRVGGRGPVGGGDAPPGEQAAQSRRSG